MKSNFSKSKSFVWLGLLGSMIGFIYQLSDMRMSIAFLLLTFVFNLSVIFYFATVLLRLYKKGGNIDIARKVLIVGILINIIIEILHISSVNDNHILIISNILYYIVWLLYLINIFENKGIKINNKIIPIITIFYIIIPFLCSSEINVSMIKDTIINRLQIILMIPYFYKYYDLVKGVKENE